MTAVLSLEEQVGALVSECQRLRAKSENDDQTIALMKKQYDSFVATVAAARTKYEQQIHELTVDCDEANVAFRKVESTLLQAAELIMQGLRAREGDGTPEKIPDRKTTHVEDDRIPALKLSSEIEPLKIGVASMTGALTMRSSS